MPESQQTQFVVFNLATEEYGIGFHLVESIIKPSEPTKMPGAPPHVRGVVNLRGKIIPVIDLRHRFGLTLVTTGEYSDPDSARKAVWASRPTEVSNADHLAHRHSTTPGPSRSRRPPVMPSRRQ